MEKDYLKKFIDLGGSEFLAYDQFSVTIVAEEGLNISSMTLTPEASHKVTENFTLQARDLSQLSRIMAKIDGIRGVIGVSRIGDEATRPKPST